MADLFDFHEDAARDQKVADPATVLTNDQLEAGGLRQVRAFVRTRASRNALRVQRHREKAAESGLQQVNVMAPEDARAAVKEIAKRTADGEPLAAVLLDVAKAPAAPAAPAPKVDTSEAADALVIAAARRSGLRGWMIRKLAGV
jgi:hypothetical protein